MFAPHHEMSPRLILKSWKKSSITEAFVKLERRAAAPPPDADMIKKCIDLGRPGGNEAHHPHGDGKSLWEALDCQHIFPLDHDHKFHNHPRNTLEIAQHHDADDVSRGEEHERWVYWEAAAKRRDSERIMDAPHASSAVENAPATIAVIIHVHGTSGDEAEQRLQSLESGSADEVPGIGQLLLSLLKTSDKRYRYGFSLSRKKLAIST